mgnify:CR=1 FL=1
MKTLTEDPPKCSHQHIVLDQFAALIGVARYVPGNGYCLDCKQPVPYKKEDDEGEGIDDVLEKMEIEP